MKPRGTGSVYARGRVLWVKYYDAHGVCHRESSHSALKSDADRLLRKRLVEVASGRRLVGAARENLRFEDLARLIVDDYRANRRRSLRRLEIGLARLAAHFAGWRACDIDYAALQAYRANRKAAPATVRWELGALRRAFNLAARDGRAECPKFPTIAVNNARQGFFEAEEWRAVRANLRSEFQDVGDVGYATGWRLMEVLTLRWAQVDLSSGLLRLEPGGTKTGAGRIFPFREYPGLKSLIERRSGVRDELQKRFQRIIPWVFFFHSDGRFHRAGDPLFRADGRVSQAWRDEWRLAVEAAGLPGRLFHDFRRSAARNMERAGLPRSVAKALGGWKSDSMYNRYAIASEADLRDGVRRLSADL